jgi:ADP-ribose pyrophosphatase YjhB (NUDIX family)
MSDGTAELRFLDPKSFREIRRIRVTDETGHAVQNLNELEYIQGEIYANIWQTNMIVRISPRTGKILGWIDLRGIIDERELASPDAVLNGIAYDSAGDRLFVTGKLWPKLFEIRITPHCRESTRPPRRRRAMLWHNDIMQIPQWLEWARRLQALGQNGLAYCKDPYDRERYQEIWQLAIEMMAKGAGLSDSTALAALFKNEEGYATPKIDIRAAVFDQERILLVKEREDGLWTLPGGWADVGDAPSFAAVREVKEESGYDIEIKKLAAVYDRDKHDHPPMAYHVYKFFFIGELCGGEAQNSLETSGVDFFGENDLPQLSVARVTPSQIEHMFVHHRNLALPTTFD